VHGPELFGFLVAVVDDVEGAAVVYADVSRRVATELETFRWRYPLRTWLYAVARRELRERRLRRRLPPQPPANVDDGRVAASAPCAPSTGAIAAIRRALSEEEREILILRVDRQLDWLELAITTLGDGVPADSLATMARFLRARVGAIIARVERVAVEHRILRPR
jgi:DNA-directed RNA polymerase specialized sigma24 family protein